MMQLRILGCSGGIGQYLRTSSYLIDEDILLDAGTGVGDMSLHEMRKLKHIFITHSHMDHIACIPLLVDTLFSELMQPLIVHAQAETIEALKQHVFNWSIWPDFTELPSKEAPVLAFEVMRPGEEIELDGRKIKMIEVNHSVPAVAYIIKTDHRVMAYSGDTTTNDSLWQALNELERLDFLIIESAFANHDLELANLASHYCPSLLGDDLNKLKHNPKLGITHLKPGEEQITMDECQSIFGAGRVLHQLSCGDTFKI